jgi:hypothetical protein
MKENQSKENEAIKGHYHSQWSGTFCGALFLITMLQGIFFAFQWPPTFWTAFAVAMAAVTLYISLKLMRRPSLAVSILILILFSAQLSIFIVRMVLATPPYSFRLLALAILFSYAATAAATLLVGVRILKPNDGFLLCFSLAVSLLIAEAILPLLPGIMAYIESPVWSGDMVPHQELGWYYRPYSTLRNYYPDNPRGYFEQEVIRETKWRLNVAQGNAARLLFPTESPDDVLVDVAKGDAENIWNVQMNQERLSAKAGQEYLVSFRAQVRDGSRTIGAGFSMAHEPWVNLGLYERINLSPDWQHFEFRFKATRSDENARLHFDLGGNLGQVEISDVSLRRIPDGRFVEPLQPLPKYYVEYKFNGLGCRGPDYRIPRDSNSMRTVLLGDSFTLGVGVQEQDTVAARLERLLNDRARSAGSQTTYEIINCGVSGYGTREERIFYEMFASKYEPDIAVLIMVANDDRSWLDDVKMGYFYQAGKIDSLLCGWSLVQHYTHRRPSPDFLPCVEEILKLRGELRERGARLAVVIFDNSPSTPEFRWDRLIATVKNGLKDTDIPVLSLGEALFAKHTMKQLMVHESDGHPNEIAHGIAAKEIMDLLDRERMLDYRSSTAGL